MTLQLSIQTYTNNNYFYIYKTLFPNTYIRLASPFRRNKKTTDYNDESWWTVHKLRSQTVYGKRRRHQRGSAADLSEGGNVPLYITCLSKSSACLCHVSVYITCLSTSRACLHNVSFKTRRGISILIDYGALSWQHYDVIHCGCHVTATPAQQACGFFAVRLSQ